MKNIIVSAIILLALAFTTSIGAAQDNATEEIADDITPYEGSIGPGHALYGLKIALENIDEGFTFNSSEKLKKQEVRARLRIAEAKAELRMRESQNADRALERYREKIEVINDSIAGLGMNDPELLGAQKAIVKHRFVLEQLLESNPDNTGLQRAFNNSLRLEERFESKTERRIERIRIKDGRIEIRVERRIREIEREERTRVRAEIIGNATQVKVEVRFVTDSTQREDIAREILNRLSLNKENISSLLEIQAEEEERLERKIEAEAEIERGVAAVEAELRFPLNTTNRTEIIEGTQRELSALTLNAILNVLETRVKEERREVRERARVKAEIIGNTAEVKMEVKFATNSTERDDIAREILDKFKLSREDIRNLLEIEERVTPTVTVTGTPTSTLTPVPARATRERLEAEARVERGITEVDAELRFTLSATSREDIVDGILKRVSDLSMDKIRNALNIEVKEGRGDGSGRDGGRGG